MNILKKYWWVVALAAVAAFIYFRSRKENTTDTTTEGSLTDTATVDTILAQGTQPAATVPVSTGIAAGEPVPGTVGGNLGGYSLSTTQEQMPATVAYTVKP